MEVIRLPIPKSGNKSAIALGMFDGCHIGHRLLLCETVRYARDNGLTAAVFTFSDDTAKKSMPMISSFDERLEHFLRLGISTVYTVSFRNVRHFTPEDFVKQVLVGMCGAEIALCGTNFRFGKGAEGDADTLFALMQALGKEAVTVPPVRDSLVTVSSSEIRRAVASGDMERAARMLGTPFSLRGEVIPGKQLGRTLGFPTANMVLPEGRLTPLTGVYCTETVVDGRLYPSVTNIGTHPTVDMGAVCNAETHLIGFEGDLYRKPIEVRFLRYLRREKKFDSPEELREQLKKDKERARKEYERSF